MAVLRSNLAGRFSYPDGRGLLGHILHGWRKKKTDRGISGGVSIVKLFCLAKVGEPLVSRPTTVQEVGFRPSNGRELRLTGKTSKDQV